MAKPEETDTRSITDIAFELVGEFALSESWLTAGAVASVLRTTDGNLYSGICLDLACGIGFCAEHSAVAEMLKNRETQISEIVAVNDKEVIPPCGRCRELLVQVNADNKNTLVRMPKGKTVALKELLPDHWIEVFSQGC